jgi:hypothetical protein
MDVMIVFVIKINVLCHCEALSHCEEEIAKQSEAKRSKAKQSEAKRSKAKQSEAKRSKAKQFLTKQSVVARKRLLRRIELPSVVRFSSQ